MNLLFSFRKIFLEIKDFLEEYPDTIFIKSINKSLSKNLDPNIGKIVLCYISNGCQAQDKIFSYMEKIKEKEGENYIIHIYYYNQIELITNLFNVSKNANYIGH